VGTKGGGASSHVAQSLLFVGREEGKLLAMRQLISSGGLTPPVLVFCQSKERAVQLTSALVLEGIRADACHADKTPDEVRTRAYCVFACVLTGGRWPVAHACVPSQRWWPMHQSSKLP